MDAVYNPLSKYRFARALRPFSLVVAVVACSLGITLGAPHSEQVALPAVLVLVAGILLQAGVNLINDHSDLHLLASRWRDADSWQLTQAATAIRFNYRAGLGCFAVATLIGGFLVWHSGWPLLSIGLVGVLGGYFYTAEPVNYKRRGYGVVLVFWLMGILMIVGAHYAVSARLDWRVALQAIPVSLLTSLILLSNELRDYEADRAEGIQTLTVRLGYPRGCQLYYVLVAGAYLSALFLYLAQLLPHLWLLPVSLLALRQPLAYLRQPAETRSPLTPLTGRFYGVFGVLLVLTYLTG